MRQLRFLCLFSLVGALAMNLTGCSETMPPLYPVSGKVTTTDGEPLKDAQISFMPDTEKGNTSTYTAVGKIKDGAYTVSTKDKPGAPAGKYKVVVITKYPGGSENPVELLPIYINPAKSTLSVEVVASPGADAYNFKVEKSKEQPKEQPKESNKEKKDK